MICISIELAENLIDDLGELIASNEPMAGYKRYYDRIAAWKKEIVELKAAIDNRDEGE